MTGNKYLLDTNIISAWLETEVAIARKIQEADGVFIPIIAVGEMYYGAQYSTRIDYNINNIAKVVSNYTVLFVDQNTCKHYGFIKVLLRKKGKPIPENDIWIAAISLQYNLVLVTRDNHFNAIETLSTERW
jgi:tRNA(fMet)-specific endonuclease VapC